MAQNKDAFEHNTALIPAWYQAANSENARVAVMLSFKENGECFLLGSPTLTKENIIALLTDVLTKMNAGMSHQIINP